jgi:putative pyruvate formate lyase activating enzyme
MPDMKYSSNENAKKYSGIDKYVENNRAAIKEMFRQKGILKFDNNGLATEGILIRHLVLPNNIAGSKDTFEFVAKEISQDTYMSVMAQYHTANISHTIKELNRKITYKEYDKVLEDFNNAGLYNGWLQELE